ncbi:MAG: hypothetical protein F4Z08_10365 [Chloroflexi bacterium]|nr:hypothetical protein [Chloroflexota bacterium]
MPDSTPPGSAPVPRERALARIERQLPMPLAVRVRALSLVGSRALVATAESALPVVARSVAVAVVALAAEQALRASLGGVIERFVGRMGRTGPATRVDITEWIMIERMRRR